MPIEIRTRVNSTERRYTALPGPSGSNGQPTMLQKVGAMLGAILLVAILVVAAIVMIPVLLAIVAILLIAAAWFFWRLRRAVGSLVPDDGARQKPTDNTELDPDLEVIVDDTQTSNRDQPVR